MHKIDRRQFLKLMGSGAFGGAYLSSISKALAIPANNHTGTIRDVEHIVVLTQENRPFDHHFGTMRGVRGFADPRAVKIPLPLKSGGISWAPVWLQPAGNQAALTGIGYSPQSFGMGAPPNGVDVIPPIRVNPDKIRAGLKSLGLTYFPGTDHSWKEGHAAWNNALYDQWASVKGPMAMAYMTREDIPYHFALAEAFTVGDAYFSSVIGPTNPNRCYLWTGCIGNVGYLGPGGTDGVGGGPVTENGLPNGAYFWWETFPEILEKAGIRWKIYQDVAGSPFKPDFGEGTSNSFAGNYTDNPLLYFSQYATSKPGSPLYDGTATGTCVLGHIPEASASEEIWRLWTESLFDDFRKDVSTGKLPQVSWICAPAGYTEHSDWPCNYGAWYISKVLEILVANPDVFSKTVFIINYDEADGSFDHVVPPTPPMSLTFGASTVDFHDEIVTTSDPVGPIGLGQRVPLILVSPWSKGGYVTSEVFDHTSVIRFIEKRFDVYEPNISPWRRSVCGDLTSAFNFSQPNKMPAVLPNTDGYLPPVNELKGNRVASFIPSIESIIPGNPGQEKGIRRARSLPYQLEAIGRLDPVAGIFLIEFINRGEAGAVFHVRSERFEDPVRMYTVEPEKQLSGAWEVAGAYGLYVYGPNGFFRSFKGSTSTDAINLEIIPTISDEFLMLDIHNATHREVGVKVLNRYTGKAVNRALKAGRQFQVKRSVKRFHGWYEYVVTVGDSQDFEVRVAGHIETGRDSYTDPLMGGLIQVLK